LFLKATKKEINANCVDAYYMFMNIHIFKKNYFSAKSRIALVTGSPVRLSVLFLLSTHLPLLCPVPGNDAILKFLLVCQRSHTLYFPFFYKYNMIAKLLSLSFWEALLCP
jgi:hypothetical protein